MPRSFTAEVKEGPTGQPSIIIQPNQENGLPENKRIRIDFSTDSSLADAQRLARNLHASIEQISVVDW